MLRFLLASSATVTLPFIPWWSPLFDCAYFQTNTRPAMTAQVPHGCCSWLTWALVLISSSPRGHHCRSCPDFVTGCSPALRRSCSPASGTLNADASRLGGLRLGKTALGQITPEITQTAPRKKGKQARLLQGKVVSRPSGRTRRSASSRPSISVLQSVSVPSADRDGSFTRGHDAFTSEERCFQVMITVMTSPSGEHCPLMLDPCHQDAVAARSATIHGRCSNRPAAHHRRCIPGCIARGQGDVLTTFSLQRGWQIIGFLALSHPQSPLVFKRADGPEVEGCPFRRAHGAGP